MMILPLADALQNCLQDLTSRIAGVDNEQMTGRAMGMGALVGYSVGAIKEQFNSPSSNIKTGSENSNGGFKGFMSRAKSIVSPNMNLSDATDYNGNTNPIRDVIKESSPIMNKSTSNQFENVNSGNTPKNTSSKVKNVAQNMARTGFNATKAYVGIGAKMAEGDFSKSPYKSNNQNTRKNNFQNIEYINNVVNNNQIENLGDENELKG